MTVDANTIKTTDLVAQSIDFTEQFSQGLSTLLNVLGVTRKQALSQGSVIKLYKTEGTLVSGDVAEGDVIPLSKVTRKVSSTQELKFGKWRKVTTAEAIQKAGFNQAVQATDQKLLHLVQEQVKTNWFNFLTTATGTTTTNGVGFQAAVASAIGQFNVVWEGYGVQPVAFVNPLDVYTYLAKAPVLTQTAFGLNYIENFLGFSAVVLSASVPAGKIYVTAPDNINLAYADLRGDLSGAFNFTTDQTGLIGVAHNELLNALSYETVVTTASILYPEISAGIIVSEIKNEASK